MFFQVLCRYVLHISYQVGGLLPKGIRTDRRIRDHDTRDGQELILKGAV